MALYESFVRQIPQRNEMTRSQMSRRAGVTSPTFALQLPVRGSGSVVLHSAYYISSVTPGAG
jgi:hypothetical protein